MIARCDACAHWQPDPFVTWERASTHREDERTGACLRYPPTASDDGLWPATRASDRCGEFTGKGK